MHASAVIQLTVRRHLRLDVRAAVDHGIGEARGRGTAPDGLPTGTPPARDQTVAFVADGNAWVLDPQSGDATCLFPAPAPGPFTWNPRGDRALLSDLEIGRSTVCSCGPLRRSPLR